MAAVATRTISLLMLLLSLRPVFTNDIYLSLQEEENYIRRGQNATFVCLHNSTNNVNVNVTSLHKLNITNGEFELLQTGDFASQRDDSASETVFSLLDVDVDDEGTYKCKVNSSDSDVVNLTIAYLETPELTASRHYPLINETVNFTCAKPSGNPPPNNYSWFKDESPWVMAGSNGKISLLIKSVNDSGSYQCRAESPTYAGSYGILSRSVNVQVLEVASSDTEAKEGDPSVVLMCEIDPIIFGINSSKWEKIIYTSAIDIQENTNKYFAIQDIAQYNLTINRVNRSDSGIYRCHFFKGFESFSGNVQLTVNYIDPPVVQSAIEIGLKGGQSGNITCIKSDAEPPVDSVTWFRDGQPIVNSDSSALYDVIENGRTLKFLSFTEAEKGEYTCRAESNAFQGTSGKNSSNSIQVDLIFLDKPQIKVSSNTINIGETVELTCILPNGNPPPNEVIWLKDGQQIDNKTINTNSGGNNEVVTLIIQSVNTESNGEYSCRVLSEAYKQQGGRESNVTKTIFVVALDEGESLDIYIIIAVSIANVVLITVIILVYICCCKRIRLSVLGQQITDAKASLIVECNYRPRLARADSVQWVTPSGPLPLMRFPSCFNTLSERKYLKEIPSDDKIELQAKGIDRMKVASNGRGTLYLEINDVTAFDSGEYTCIVSRRNGKKTATHSGIMTVHSKLIVAVGEAFSANDSLTISCMCLPFNEPVDSFIWFLADETGEVQQGHGSALASSTDITSRGRYSCACEGNTCYLRISEPTDEDARNYQCKVIRKYDNIPFQGVIVLTKDRHTLEWKMSQFVPQGVPKESKSTDTLTSGGPLLSKDTIRASDIKVVYEVTDESILTANDAINGGDKFVVENGDNIIDNNQCNSDTETKPNMNEQPFNTNGGEIGGNDVGSGSDYSGDNADHDDVTLTETERDVCKDSDVQLPHSAQETTEQGNAKLDTKENIKANNGYDINADIDERLILNGNSEEFTGNKNQGLEAMSENSNGESCSQNNEKTQSKVEMDVHDNGDVDKWLDLKSNIEVNIQTVALDEVNDNPTKIEPSNIQVKTEKDDGNSEEDVKTNEI